MKKSTRALCFSLFALSSSAFAHHGHFYTAADVGIFTADFDNAYIQQPFTGISVFQNFQDVALQNGYTGGLELGYSRRFHHRYFWGAEVSGNINSRAAVYQAGVQSSSFYDKTRINGNMDFDFVPGIKLTRTISAFMKLGVSIAWIKDNLTSPVGYFATMTNYSNANTAVGFAAGLGVSKLISKHWSLFSEADYHDYGTINFVSFQNYSYSYAHSTRAYSYDVVAGAAYKFA